MSHHKTKPTMSTTSIIISSIIFAICLIDLTLAASKSVFRVKYFGTTRQLITSDTLAWEAYTGDENQLKYAVQGATYRTADSEQGQSIYVCRNFVEGVATVGKTGLHGNDVVCEFPMSSEIRTHRVFDILINRGHGAKLTWQPWSKFSGKIPLGAVSVTYSGHVSLYYFETAHL